MAPIKLPQQDLLYWCPEVLYHIISGIKRRKDKYSLVIYVTCFSLILEMSLSGHKV